MSNNSTEKKLNSRIIWLYFSLVLIFCTIFITTTIVFRPKSESSDNSPKFNQNLNFNDSQLNCSNNSVLSPNISKKEGIFVVLRHSVRADESAVGVDEAKQFIEDNPDSLEAKIYSNWISNGKMIRSYDPPIIDFKLPVQSIINVMEKLKNDNNYSYYPKVIILSPFLRCIQTGLIIGRYLNVSHFIIDYTWMEGIDGVLHCMDNNQTKFDQIIAENGNLLFAFDNKTESDQLFYNFYTKYTGFKPIIQYSNTLKIPTNWTHHTNMKFASVVEYMNSDKFKGEDVLAVTHAAILYSPFFSGYPTNFTTYCGWAALKKDINDSSKLQAINYADSIQTRKKIKID